MGNIVSCELELFRSNILKNLSHRKLDCVLNFAALSHQLKEQLYFLDLILGDSDLHVG